MTEAVGAFPGMGRVGTHWFRLPAVQAVAGPIVAVVMAGPDSFLLSF